MFLICKSKRKDNSEDIINYSLSAKCTSKEIKCDYFAKYLNFILRFFYLTAPNLNKCAFK